MNLSVRDVAGAALVVSQFTLAADLRGNRPGFSTAAAPDEGKRLYEHFTAPDRGRGHPDRDRPVRGGHGGEPGERRAGDDLAGYGGALGAQAAHSQATENSPSTFPTAASSTAAPRRQPRDEAALLVLDHGHDMRHRRPASFSAAS